MPDAGDAAGNKLENLLARFLSMGLRNSINQALRATHNNKEDPFISLLFGSEEECNQLVEFLQEQGIEVFTQDPGNHGGGGGTPSHDDDDNPGGGGTPSHDDDDNPGGGGGGAGGKVIMIRASEFKKAMDLAEKKFPGAFQAAQESAQHIDYIHKRYGNKKFTPAQITELALAHQNGLTDNQLDLIADKALNPAQMLALRNIISKTTLDPDFIASMAKAHLQPERMAAIAALNVPIAAEQAKILLNPKVTTPKFNALLTTLRPQQTPSTDKVSQVSHQEETSKDTVDIDETQPITNPTEDAVNKTTELTNATENAPQTRWKDDMRDIVVSVNENLDKSEGLPTPQQYIQAMREQGLSVSLQEQKNGLDFMFSFVNPEEHNTHAGTKCAQNTLFKDTSYDNIITPARFTTEEQAVFANIATSAKEQDIQKEEFINKYSDTAREKLAHLIPDIERYVSKNNTYPPYPKLVDMSKKYGLKPILDLDTANANTNQSIRLASWEIIDNAIPKTQPSYKIPQSAIYKDDQVPSILPFESKESTYPDKVTALYRSYTPNVGTIQEQIEDTQSKQPVKTPLHDQDIDSQEPFDELSKKTQNPQER